MLTTILNLNKRVLVVDAPIGELAAIGNDKEVYYAIKSEGENYTKIADGKKWKFLCKGEELTEEMAEQLVKVGDEGFECWDYKNNKWGAFGFSPIESFISAIEASGHYWLDPPKRKPEFTIDWYGKSPSEFERYENDMQEWQEAESKTFKNPLIFEIL